jgi:hypothetical protein
LEDTLSAADQAAAREHVEKCGVCQKTLAQQETFENSIRLSFHRETQGLSLRPETKRTILNAVKRAESSPTLSESIQAFFAAIRRYLAWVGIVVVCSVLLISARRFYLGSTMNSSAQATVKDDRITCVINVPIRNEMPVYRKENNTVVDAVVIENSVMDAGFSENIRSFPSSQPHIN